MQKSKPRAKPKTRLPPEPLTASEVYRLMDACGAGICGCRDRAMIAVWWRAGIRCSELLALQPRDIDRGRDGMTIRIREGKGNKARTVGISTDAAGIVDAWLQMWESRFPTAKTLFCTVKRHGGPAGQKMKPITVRQLLRRLRKKAGLTKRAHAHGLRHTFALDLDDENTPLRIIQQSLGHANAQTTSVYLSSMGGREVLGTLKNRTLPPRG